jgi:transketolase
MDDRSKELRKLIIMGLENGNRGHIGPSMSLVEILRVLYDDILRFNPKKPNWEMRDRFILSKGHGCLALYAILIDKGFIKKNELKRFCKFDSILGGHPEYNKIKGIEASTGSLGHGFPIAVGMAIASKIKKISNKIIAITGDGEMNEGSNWEAAMTASKHKLSNLTLIIDYNKIQSYGFTKDVLDLEPLKKKLISFGFACNEVDGHNIVLLKKTFLKLPFNPKKPSAVICHTIKGKGIIYAEGKPEWHHKSKISKEHIKKMYESLNNYN